MVTAMQKAMDISIAMKVVFWLCKESLSLSKYTSLINFLKMLKVPALDHLAITKHTNYTSYPTALDIVGVLSDIIDTQH